MDPGSALENMDPGSALEKMDADQGYFFKRNRVFATNSDF